MRVDILVGWFRTGIDVLRIATMVVAVVAVVVGLTMSRAHAEDLTVSLGGISYHTSSDDTNTWFHRSVVFKKGDFSGGYLKNSYGNDSWVVAYRVWEQSSAHIHTEFSLAAVRGYDKCFGEFTKSERASGKDKAEVCFLPLLTLTYMSGTVVEPQVSIWGDAVVFTGLYKF